MLFHGASPCLALLAASGKSVKKCCLYTCTYNTDTIAALFGWACCSSLLGRVSLIAASEYWCSLIICLCFLVKWMGEYFATHPPSIPRFGRGESKQDTHSFRNLSLQHDQIISTHPALAQANSIFLEKVHLVAVLRLSVPLGVCSDQNCKGNMQDTRVPCLHSSCRSEENHKEDTCKWPD